MDRHFFEKRCHYSIRKFAIGAASVMIGASIFGANMVQAAETVTPSETEGSITHVQALDKLPDDLAAALEKADAEAATEVSHEETPATDEGTNPTSSEEAKPETSPTSPKPAERRNRLKHQRQTINHLKLLRPHQNQLKSKSKIEKMSTISKVLLLRQATMRLVPTLLRIKLSMEMTIPVGLQIEMQ